MKRYLVLLTVMALPVPSFAADTSTDIRVKDLGGGDHQLTLISAAVTNTPAAQAALLPAAQALCADQPPHFGHFEYHLAAPQGSPGKGKGAGSNFVFVQQVHCGDVEPAEAPPPPPPDPNWQASDADYHAFYDAVIRYFAAKDKGDVIATYAMLDQGLKKTIPFQRWVTLSDDFTAQAGPAVKHWVVKFTWRKDPEGAPEPGVYATADFVDHYQKVDADCGVISMRRLPDGSFLVVNEQHGFVPLNSKQTLSAADLAALRNKLGCLSE